MPEFSAPPKTDEPVLYCRIRGCKDVAQRWTGRLCVTHHYAALAKEREERERKTRKERK